MTVPSFGGGQNKCLPEETVSLNKKKKTVQFSRLGSS